MKAVVLDPLSYLDTPLEDALADRGIRVLSQTSSGPALKSCITNPDTGLFLIFLPGDDLELYDETASRIREINPLLEVICITASDAAFNVVQSAAVDRGVMLASLSAGPDEVADMIARHGKESRQGRQAHRIDVNIRAVLYRHDDFDQKVPEGSHLVEVISLSSNGAYVAVGRVEVQEGETYLFEINLPDLIYLVKGRVVWVNLEGTQGGRPRGFALSFLDMSNAPQEFLEKRIHEDMIDSILKRRGIL